MLETNNVFDTKEKYYISGTKYKEVFKRPKPKMGVCGVGHFCLVIKQYWTLFEHGKSIEKTPPIIKCVRHEEME